MVQGLGDGLRCELGLGVGAFPGGVSGGEELGGFEEIDSTRTVYASHRMLAVGQLPLPDSLLVLAGDPREADRVGSVALCSRASMISLIHAVSFRICSVNRLPRAAAMSSAVVRRWHRRHNG
jgi:hypothetical protein